MGVKCSYKTFSNTQQELQRLVTEVLSDEEDETVAVNRELRAKRSLLPRHIDEIKTPQLNNSFMRAARLSRWPSSREEVGRQNDRRFIGLRLQHSNFLRKNL